MPTAARPMRAAPEPALAEPALSLQPSAWTALRRFVAKVLAIAGMDMRKLRHEPSELFTRAIQPVLWLLVFGQVFARSHSIPTGGIDYLAFLAPGVLAQSVLFVAIFNGISVIWERDLGIVHKFLASPAPRSLCRVIASCSRPRARRCGRAPAPSGFYRRACRRDPLRCAADTSPGWGAGSSRT